MSEDFSKHELPLRPVRVDPAQNSATDDVVVGSDQVVPVDDGDELSVRQLLEEPGVLQLQEVVQDDLPCPRFQTLAACGPGHL